MATIASRTELRDYCLRRLGFPVIEINVDDDQVEDRLDDAFQFYRDYHYDAIEKVYLKHQMTQEEITQRYITVPDSVIGITGILPFTNKATGTNLFSLQYQILINDLYSLMSTDLIYYYEVKRHIELINFLLSGVKSVRFNRHMNQLFVDMNWAEGVAAGDYIVVECYRILDPDTFTDVYNDRFLKMYATALIKRQWGENMKKFGGIQLPGGVILNGKETYDEAIEEIKQIEAEMQSKFELPVDFMIG